MENFQSEIQSTQEQLADVDDAIDEVLELHQRLLASVEFNPELSSEIETKTTEIKQNALKIKKKLQELERDSRKKSNKASRETKQEQVKRCSERFNFLMEKFSTAQLHHKENCINQIKRQLEIIGQEKTDDEIDDMISSGNIQVFADGMREETELAKKTLRSIEYRHKDILLIEKSVRELNDMFIDLSLLVENQGQLIDDIEAAADETEANADRANVDMKAANEHNKSARKKKIIIALIIAAVAVIGIILLIVLLSVYLPKPKN